MNNEVALLTTLYPTEERFIRDFTESLREQTERAFDLVVINDKSRIDCGHSFFKDLNTFEFKYSSTISKNREYGLRKVKEAGYKYVIFCDIDDSFNKERVCVVHKALQENDIVINDMNVVDENNSVKVFNYISQNIDESVNLDIDFILQKNVFGFSNTGIRTRLIDDKLSFPEDLRIVDWYFYTRLLRKDVTVGFVRKPLTNYRQHYDNLIGAGYYNVTNFRKMAQLKYEHFEFLSERDSFFIPLMENSVRALQMTESEIEDTLREKSVKINNPLWWEIVNI